MTLQLTAATSSKIVRILKDLIFEYLDMENTYRYFEVGKMLSTQSAKRARCKNTNHSCGTLQGVRKLVFEQVLLNNAYWQPINTTNNLLIEYVKHKCLMKTNSLLISPCSKDIENMCCVFIDFEYICLSQIPSITSAQKFRCLNFLC